MAAFVFVALVVVLELLTFATNRLVRHWRRSARRGDAAQPQPQPQPQSKPQATTAPDPEACLVADLVAGRMSAPAYHDAMEAIARAEDLRSPLLVPGEGGRDVS